MNNFYNDMLLRLGMPIEDTVGVRITICDLKGVFIEGHKGLLLYTPYKIALRIKNKKLEIEGANLIINEVSFDELYIRGNLKRIEVIND